MKVKFTVTQTMAYYNGLGGFYDGEVKDVPEDDVIRLCRDFPQNFTKDVHKKAAEPETDIKKVVAPQTKAIKPKKNK